MLRSYALYFEVLTGDTVLLLSAVPPALLGDALSGSIALSFDSLFVGDCASFSGDFVLPNLVGEPGTALDSSNSVSSYSLESVTRHSSSSARVSSVVQIFSGSLLFVVALD